MTQGKPSSHIFRFALPVMGSYICQQLYTLSDAAVLGRLVGVQAFAAVGAAGLISWMAISIVLGLTQGFGTLLAQRYGAGDWAGLRRSMAMSVWIALAAGLLIAAAGLLCVKPVLRILNTPPELISESSAYLYWMLGGIPVTMAYNLTATLLRSLGDSKTPFTAVILSSVTNIILDILLVTVFRMGVAGVAVATVLSQACAFAWCVYALRTEKKALPKRADFIWEPRIAERLLPLGVPLAFRNAVISAGGLAVQAVINGYGALFIAGVTAAKKYYGLIEIACAGLEGAIGTYVGQNAGAKQPDRIREGVAYTRRVGLIAAITIAALAALFARPLVGLLVSGEPEEAAALQRLQDTGVNTLRAMAACVPALYMLCIHRSAIQGLGNAIYPMLSGFTELALRLLSVWLLVRWAGEWGIYFADGIGWIGAACLLRVAYIRVFRRS
jgi:putative MATE family efflux protein